MPSSSRPFLVAALAITACLGIHGCNTGKGGSRATVAGIPVALAFVQQPGGGFSGQPLNPLPSVAVVDGTGAVVSGATATNVTIALGTNPNGAALSGTLTIATVGGVASYTDVRVNLDGTYTLVASAPGLQSATSGAFTTFPSGISILTLAGTVTQRVAGADVAAANSTVNVWALDEDGFLSLLVGTTTTSVSGAWTVTPTAQGPAVRYAVEAVSPPPGAPLVAYVGSNTTAQVVNEVTRGIVDTVLLITETRGGRSISDYTGAELDSLIPLADAALTTAGTNRSDPIAVAAAILAALGGQIADLSEGTFQAARGRRPAPPAPLDQTTGGGAPATAFDGATPANRWDAQADGRMLDGSSDAFDDMFGLEINGTLFPVGLPASFVQDNRELVIGPDTNFAGTGLNVTRKVFVSLNTAAPNFCRFLEVLENPTAAGVTVTVRVPEGVLYNGGTGNLGSDEANNFVFADVDGNSAFSAGDLPGSTDGDELVEPTDFWLVNHNAAAQDPALAFFFRGATPTKVNDELTYSFTNVLVPAGGTVRLVHFGFQQQGATPGAFTPLVALMQQLAVFMPDALCEGLTAAEIATIPATNLAPGDGVFGGAGAMGSFSTVTLTNQRSGAVVNTPAESDGAFAAGFPTGGLQAGDLVRVQSTDGTDVTITAP